MTKKPVEIPKHIKLATDACRDAEPQKTQYELKDSQVPGLQLRINPGETKTWVLRYRIRIGTEWKNRRMTLGAFPDVSVAAARKEAENRKTDIDRGADPMGERRAVAEQRAEAIEAKKRGDAARTSVAEFFERWMKSKKPRDRDDDGAAIRANFEKNVLPSLGSLEMKDVTSAHILSIIDTMLERGVNRQAQVAFSDMNQFFKFAVSRVIERSPMETLKKSDVGEQPSPRDRVLPPDEIRLLNQKMLSSSLNRPTQLAYLISLSTVCRIGEIGCAEWREIDWAKKTWTIPKEHTKNRQPITIFLSNIALNLFKELQTFNGDSDYCMPNSERTGPVYEKALTKHAHDRQRPEGVPPTAGRTTQTRSLVIGEIWTPHDLRRSGSTLIQKLGYTTEIAQRCLNHKIHTKVQRAYLHDDPVKAMRRAWRDLGQALEVILSSEGEAFLKALQDDFEKDTDEEVGLAAIVKKFHEKLQNETKLT